MPSVKGKDSILNGISAINEYKIFIDPKCVNTVREFSSYIYDERRNDRGQRMPKDSDNHLCDALRYAFADVKLFRPNKDSKARTSEGYITNRDLNGGWDI